MAVMISVAVGGGTDSAAPPIVVTLYYDRSGEGSLRTHIKTLRDDSCAIRPIWGRLLEARAWNPPNRL